jgi:hypothetical protein
MGRPAPRRGIETEHSMKAIVIGAAQIMKLAGQG